ncbi:MAG: nicotianamine synthase family protein [Andreesenia angusta]|nr:nicotianamine synthase family protein [Andreesenia angusta]
MIASITKNIEYQFSGFGILVKIIERYYQNIVKNEIRVSGIKSSDRVLCIGGGSVPCTAILINKLTNAKVKVIDVDLKALRKAENLIKKLNLEKEIDIEYGNGNSIDCKKFDIIHIALQVHPREKIIRNVLNTCKYGNKVIVRMPKDCLKGFYSDVKKEKLGIDNVNIVTESFSSKFNTMKEVLLIEKAEGIEREY